MDQEKIKELQKKISTNTSQIKLLEGEYDFLMGELKRYTNQLLNKSLSKILDDPKAIKILGKEIYEDQKNYAKNRDADEILVDKAQWEHSFKQITDEIVRLHNKQIDVYQDVKKTVSECDPEDEAIKDFDHTKIDDVIYSYVRMVDVYQHTYERLKVIKQ